MSNYREKLEEVCALPDDELIDEAQRQLKNGTLGKAHGFVNEIVTTYREVGAATRGQLAGVQRCVAYQWARDDDEDTTDDD